MQNIFMWDTINMTNCIEKHRNIETFGHKWVKTGDRVDRKTYRETTLTL